MMALIAAPFFLTACAGGSARYPSLEIRPAERAEGSFAVAGGGASTLTEAPMPEGTLARLGELEARARAAHSRFVARAPAAGSLVEAGRGADVSDNRWGAAQIALADLDGIRSETAVALGDLDLLYVDATLAFTERDAIGRTRAGIVALIAEEDRILAGLRARAAP
ncbi:hypothetical protein U4960_07625 [Altererythrobacter sp. H2]|uniref:hypothetical protein n=1 Tax=Altererythrobacter sp. H2 TaxID=3108391 RepID=UPI000BD540C8|nr:hypothetical protein [Altererythrobacter sp. H2]OZA93114.1 MAG: hypothetical protein B7X57_06045 [Erythrobacter sp. 34-65-8]WRK97174.1 hypothetical protein U4960_07625 [Altererythrobacter sp. H2]